MAKKIVKLIVLIVLLILVGWGIVRLVGAPKVAENTGAQHY